MWGLGRRGGPPGDSAVESVVRASFALAAARHGALIVLPGRDPLDRHLEGGVPLDVVPGPDVLRARIARFSGAVRVDPVDRGRSLRGVGRRAGEWGVALALSLTFWTLVVLGSEVGEVSLRAPVQVTNLPAGYVLRSLKPEEVQVSLSGVRRRLFLLEPTEVTVSVDVLLAQLGRRSFAVTPQDVHAPPGDHGDGRRARGGGARRGGSPPAAPSPPGDR